jgi:hypothetical protein
MKTIPMESRKTRREEKTRKERDKEKRAGAGYGFSLAIGTGPVPSILKGTIVEEPYEQISSMLGNSAPLTAIKRGYQNGRRGEL